MIWLSIFLMLIVGVTLGILGSGGSILTLPILIYIAHIEPVTATSYTLFIVGLSALFGSIRNISSGLIDSKILLYFGLPSLLSVYLTRYFILPSLPDILFELDSFKMSKDLFLIIILAFLMIISALTMLRKKTSVISKEKFNSIQTFVILFIQGIAIGIVTGFVGAGGGFLIIPVLVSLCNLPVKKAIATSLAIIAINASIGFIGDISQGIVIDYTLLLYFSISSLLGTFIGLIIGKSINENQLKIIFGWFVLIMGVFIFVKELFF
jgi:uncharacterized membrane protein YfcA